MSEIFRKKSLDKISSPESLNDYIRVSSPAVWLIIAAVIVLLAGTCIWGFFGYIESTVKADARAEGGSVVCFVGEKDIESVEAGQTVRIGDAEGVISEVGEKDEAAGTYRVCAEVDVEDGIYIADIVTDKVRPVSFVLN